MKELAFLHQTPVYLEISQGSLKALREDAGLEVPLEREPGGRLTTSCREKLTRELRGFLNWKNWQPRVRAYCAIAANGVSLPRLSLPASNEEGFSKLLLLQIEREFPLAPDELAWGCRRVESNGKSEKREVLVAAVKKEVVEELTSIFLACGLHPVFTLAALARNAVCPESNGSHAMLDLGNSRPEWAVFEKGNLLAVRLFPSSSEASITDSLSKISSAERSGRTLYLTEASEELASQLRHRIGNELNCVALKMETGTAHTAAVLGLKRIVERNSGELPLILRTKAKRPVAGFDLSSPETKKWLVRAVALIAVLLLLPYGEAVLVKPFLIRKLSTLKADKGRLETIDRELSFLQHLKANQPPYLDALFVFAKSAPQGMRIESLTINRRGDISLRGVLQNGQQVTDFRTKLIASGLFLNVAVEEQTPTPDRQKVNVRMTAQWKPAEARVGLTIGPTVEEIERAKTNKTAQVGGPMPGGMMPPIMPPMGMPGDMPLPGPRRK